MGRRGSRCEECYWNFAPCEYLKAQYGAKSDKIRRWQAVKCPAHADADLEDLKKLIKLEQQVDSADWCDCEWHELVRSGQMESEEAKDAAHLVCS